MQYEVQFEGEDLGETPVVSLEREGGGGRQMKMDLSRDEISPAERESITVPTRDACETQRV